MIDIYDKSDPSSRLTMFVVLIGQCASVFVLVVVSGISPSVVDLFIAKFDCDKLVNSFIATESFKSIRFLYL